MLHTSQRQSSISVWWHTLRTPVLLFGAALWIAFDKAFIPNLAVFIHDVTPSSVVFRFWVLPPDYFVYLPNLVVFLSYLLGACVLLELKHARWPRNRTAQQDLWTALIALAFALSSQLFMTNRKPGMLHVMHSTLQVGVLWLFVMLNANLFLVHRALTTRPWMSRLLHWTFPISDLFGYLLHRDRLKATAGWLGWLPTACVIGAIVAALGVKTRVLASAIRAQRVQVPVHETQWAQWDANGFWFTNWDSWDSRSGIWYYDDRSGTGSPYIRTADCRQAYYDGDHFYYHDRYDHFLRKVNARTRQVVWKVPVKPFVGTTEVVGRNGLVVAAGEAGYIIVVSTDGRVIGEKEFPILTWTPQAVWGDQVAFLTGDQNVHLWNSTLTKGEIIPLPLPPGVKPFVWGAPSDRMRSVTNWTDYVEDTATLYVQTFWGEIYRYNVKERRWLTSLKTDPGLRSIRADSQHQLLFAWNYYQGYISVLDLETGRRVGYILANALGRYINLDPQRMQGVANTRGYGIWRFAYEKLLAHRANGRAYSAYTPDSRR
ncbi:MAG: hypothetical protein COV75_02255 [Candidatus Omnitrophica bacterium CG11_big_fil_rev_8_21_14_0_20_63_9]|nr:MAG: hypothetical protein COV75_02255 [Candidatus Omnitrophica bacterium CG11_big_fil_rev_8_21_14_0_20_63_9]